MLGGVPATRRLGAGLAFPGRHDRSMAADRRDLRVLVVGRRERKLSAARDALRADGHAVLGAADVDAALEQIDSVDVLVLDPADDPALVPALGRALALDADVVLYGDHFAWLGRAGRSVILVPEGQMLLLLAVLAEIRRRRDAERRP